MEKHAAGMAGPDWFMVAGDFDASAMAAQVKQAFGGWGKAAGTLPQVEAKPRELGRRVLLVDKPGATQTYYALANNGSRHGDLAQLAPRLVDAGVERFDRALDGFERQTARHQACGQQVLCPKQARQRQRGGHLGTVEQSQPFLGAQHKRCEAHRAHGLRA